MSINFFKEDVSIGRFNQTVLKKWIDSAVKEEGFKTGEISFIFCSDQYLLEINKQYLDHHYFTDVITFDYVDGKDISGDIFISIDRIKENAVEYGVSFQQELERVVIHGVLHLIGYDDKDDVSQLVMTQKEDEYLEKLAKFYNRDN